MLMQCDRRGPIESVFSILAHKRAKIFVGLIVRRATWRTEGGLRPPKEKKTPTSPLNQRR